RRVLFRSAEASKKIDEMVGPPAAPPSAEEMMKSIKDAPPAPPRTEPEKPYSPFSDPRIGEAFKPETYAPSTGLPAWADPKNVMPSPTSIPPGNPGATWTE